MHTHPSVTNSPVYTMRSRKVPLKTDNVPGPGSYMPARMSANKAGKFGSERRAVSNVPNVVPGPGAYNVSGKSTASP